MIKPGMKVKIKDIDDIDKETSNIVFLERSMGKFCNEFANVTGIYDDNPYYLRLDIDDGEYVWDIKWLEKASHHIELPDNLFEI